MRADTYQKTGTPTKRNQRVRVDPIVLSFTAAALLCLASVIHYEARGEPTEGKVAVASVVLNRVDSPQFPDTVCEVVAQRGQFPWYRRRPLTYGNEARLAEEILTGERPRNVRGAYYFSPARSFLSRPVVARIGSHTFFGM